MARHAVLWLLAIGVSHYRQPSLQLQFAASDARAIAAVLEQQRGGTLFRDVQTRVLTDEEVTRESILDSMSRFMGQAGPDDVAAIFLAGHGVQERSTGSYYFLPSAATESNLVTAGLRMSDFDEMLRVVRRNVRGVMVMLDTCHAGALQIGDTPLARSQELASSLSAGDGFFLLAATRPGEVSEENPSLGHGVFTRALLDGLDGAADSDRDGFVSAAELFSYVARAVPRLTGQQQHPYHKMEGTDLLLAAVRPGGASPAPAGGLEPVLEPEWTTPAVPAHALDVNAIAVLEFRNLQGDPQREWMGNALRAAFNTELSKVTALHVYAPEVVDRKVAGSGAGYLDAARQMGIGKLITGSFQVVGDGIRIDAQILDTASGTHESSDSVQGSLGEFFDLEKRLVLSMLHRLRVRLSPSEGQAIEQDTNTDVDAYRLLLQSEGLLGATPAPSVGTPPPHGDDRRSQLGSWESIAALGASPAYAQEPPGGLEGDVQEFLDRYRRALEDKDLTALSTLYVVFPPAQRDIVRAYLDNAERLTVAISAVSIQRQGSEVIVSFKRSDGFVDHKTGRSVRLEVRLTKILVREQGTWRIAP
ncbi:MAG TPA: caspase family protein [Candidatus Binatia bacterium]|nr:caspase family protein [Candidatus Binatia bacterium]